MENLKRINNNSKQRNVIIEKYQNCEIVIRVKYPKSKPELTKKLKPKPENQNPNPELPKN